MAVGSPDGPDLVAVEGIVRGLVQGVSYRASFQRAAVSRGLTGWVRNQPDGTVAFLIQGPPDAVQEMLGWAAKGPRLARVNGVDTSAIELQNGLTTFDIRY